MKWFQGNLNEAVAASKSRKAIFVVFIEGKDNASLEIANVIDSQEISSRLEQENFVAVKLEGGSEAYGFFTQIYQLVPIPSLFFIGQSGEPLEVIAGATSVGELESKIETVLAKVDPSSKCSSTSLIQSEQKESSGSSSSKNNSETELSAVDLDGAKSEITLPPVSDTSKSQDNEKIPDVAQSETRTDTVEPNPPSTSNVVSEGPKKPELTTEEKIERARQLIELQKRQREEEEAKKIREREIERRKSGQEMLRIKQQQQELEIKQAYEERMKEKAAEAAARDKVRQQIAQDKLERKQRERDLQQQYAQQSPVQEQPKPRTPLSNDSGIARIQFRLPSGSPHMGQFDSSSTLGALRSYVVDNIELPFRQFILSTSFPRRDLTVKDDDKTLLELELVPTSVILILPLRNTSNTTAVTSAQDEGYLSRFMWAIYASIVSVYSYVKGYFIRPRPRSAEQSPGSTPGEINPSTSNVDREIPQGGQGGAPRPGLLRRNLGGQAATIRAQGNVHRLHSGGDQDNDENNTWNGNSTQQM